MTHASTLSGPFARPGRAFVVAALASLALVGCGGQDGPGPGAEAGKAGTPSSSADRAAFAAMLDEVTRPCPPPGTAPAAPKPTGAQRQQSLAPGEAPPTGPIEPGAPSGPETVLNARDWCASVQHEQRIVEALQAVANPTPANVRKTLNGLGYIDERIHGLEQDGRTTRFRLDLREGGGRLCEVGTAAGEATEVTACVAPATGAFTVGETGDQPS